jgi:nitrate reductase gamma subunit
MPRGDTVINRITIVALSLASITLSGVEAKASWLVDSKKFHISAHGQTSCQDCHEDIAEKTLHPNPGDVNKELTDLFSADQCLSCHDDIMDDLDQGLHGAKKVKDPKKYGYCLQCHNPHYQPRLGENRIGRFHPTKPRHEQCGACHEQRSALPALSPEDEACMKCHRSVDPEDLRGKERIAELCFLCHGQTGTQAQKMTGKVVPLINQKEYQSTPHAGITCTVCHPQSAQFNHTGQRLGDCHQCHLPHDEKVSRDVHAGVACEACHLKGIEPVRDPQSKVVIWKKEPKVGKTSTVHQMLRINDGVLCQRCHFRGNQIGAVSIILPAKSILCMPCHAGTFSVGDTITILALIVFLAGVVLTVSVLLTGSLRGQSDLNFFHKIRKILWTSVITLFSRKMFLIIKAMILDVLFQRRLYRQSQTRWLIHSLIFLPLVLRFFWGFLALIGSLCKPECSSVWAMLDKNYPATAFLFDVTGIMIILGVILAFIRGGLRQPSQLPGLPRQDRVALSLIAGIIVVGFILEGMRVSMTGHPHGAGYAFLGYRISMLFTETRGLTEAYGYLWYIHAILTGVFVAYLPFSRLLHIIVAPVVLAINAVYEHD